MGTVGLSFGSPTGGQGFNVATTVSQIMSNYQAIETPWKNQLTSLQAQDTALSTIGTDLSSLSTAFSALTNFQGALASKEGSSSDPSILAITSAGTSAVAGSHTISVTKLATTSSWSTSSTRIAATDTLAGSFSVQVGSGAAQTFQLNSSNNTLSSLAAAINNAGIGVSANVITDSTGSFLSLVSGTSGSAGNLTLSGSLTDQTASGTPAVNFTQAQAGADAQLTVDGVSLTSGSNTVTNAIPGVTFQLLQANPSTQVQMEITNNTSAVTGTVQSFVNAYNTVVKDVNAQEGNDSSGKPEPLFGSSTIALLQEKLGAAINTTTSGSGINGFGALGITINNDGTLSLNTDTLNSALNQNYQGVVNFFQGASSGGMNFSNVLSGLSSSSSTGVIHVTLKSNAAQESALNASITNENSIIATQTAKITAELNSANQTLQAIPTLLSEVSVMYSAITGYNQYHP
ncbi:MAG TPA: flagellar filament capping protein FliD [Acidobacteriaceae bacterium]